LERVNDFLRLGAVKYAEIEQQRQPVQIMDILDRIAPEMRVRARWVAVDLHMDIPTTLPRILAGTEDIQHMMSNLINNAIKYTEPGGRVSVSLKAEGERVIGVVEDTGIGIAPQDLPRIFQEFYRAEDAKDKAQGTGLGLSIVKRVVDLYGGQIDVESEPGEGSKFVFSFPAIEEAQETVQ
jgi:two-component system phosphate regulon sensor histidine kinase PhoR